MKFISGLLALVLLLSPCGAFAWKTAGGFSEDWPHVTIHTQQLGPHLYYLQGSGANLCLSTGPDGNLLVDCEFAQVSSKILAAVSQLSPGPVRYLIDTHWHGDHTGGNADFARQGATIVAQENVRTRLMSPQVMTFFNAHIPAAPPEAWPRITYDHAMTLHWNGEDVQLFHHGPAHTDGDTVVFFPKSNVIHLGDVYINGLYPIIDLSSKGTIDGYFPVLDQALVLCNDQTRVIPGHGPVATKKDLAFYRAMLWTIRNRVRTLIASGQNLSQITASRPSREFDAGWASDRVGPTQLTKMIYESLKSSSTP